MKYKKFLLASIFFLVTVSIAGVYIYSSSNSNIKHKENKALSQKDNRELVQSEKNKKNNVPKGVTEVSKVDKIKMKNSDEKIEIISENSKTTETNFPLPLGSAFTNKFKVNVTINGKGKVIMEPNKEYYETGDVITFKAIPEDGWRFYEWYAYSDRIKESVIQEKVYGEKTFAVTFGVPMNFSDKAFEGAIREKLNKQSGEIITSELGDMTTLDLQGKVFKNIEGIQYCRLLKTLNIKDTAISDISSLAECKNLQELYVANSPISNIGSLNNLIVLKTVAFDSVPISDISPLSNNQYLNTLLLYSTNVSNLKPIKTISNLERLEVRYSNLNNTEGIENLKKLEVICFEGNVSNKTEGINLDGLKNLPSLKYFSLCSTNTNSEQIRNIGNFISLKGLDLYNNNITDISTLYNLKNLESLGLSTNHISNLSSIGNFVKLNWLNFSYNDVRDITPLSGLINLETLCLAQNPVTDFTPVKNIYPKLKSKDFDLP